MDRPPTRLVTLNQLVGVTGVDDAQQAIAVDDTDHDGTEPTQVTFDRISVGDRPALWFTFQTEAARAHDEAVTLGRRTDLREQHSGGVLVIDVDDRLYAISFGQGFRRILDGYRDQRFGLRVALRTLGAHELAEIGQGNGLSEIVRRLGRRTLPMTLTHQPAGDQAAKLIGSSGLRLRLGLTGDDLVTDIRAIAAIHDRPLPLPDRPELALLDDVAPVSDTRTRRQLDADLEDILSDPAELTGARGNLAINVPGNALARLGEARSYRVAVGGGVFAGPDLTLTDIATAITNTPPGERLSALTNGQIAPCELPGGRRQLVRPSALAWLEATVVIGDRHFALLDGEWLELDRDFALKIRREADTFIRTNNDLPPWPAGFDEAQYRRHVQQADPRYLALDGNLGDLLGPDDELILVTRARGSSTLSRLFARGLTAWERLRDEPETRPVVGQFREPADYRPGKVVFAVLPEAGRPLTLFPFAQAALVRAAAELKANRVEVEVVGLPVAATAALSA